MTKGTLIATQRAQETRADIDYFDRREARDFLIYKAIVWGVPSALVILVAIAGLFV
jgi:hypothetical protein